MTTTDARPDLIEWEGHVVPWVTRWTGEIIPKQITTRLVAKEDTGQPAVHIGYDDGVENREVSGVLWMREGLKRTGKPEFSQVNAYRQRLCMARRRCQVCGDTIPDGVIRWLVPEVALTVAKTGETITMSPPTCESCIPIALSLCPHLKSSDWVMARVLEYRIWGVLGDVVLVDSELKVTARKHLLVPYEDPRKSPNPFPYFSVYARQQVVEFTKFTIEEAL